MGAAAFGGIVGKDFANKALGQIAFGALSGAIGAEATGGEWWKGDIIGGMVAGLNHAMHDRAQKGKQQNKKPWDLNGDGRLQKIEADRWYIEGNGVTINVDGNKILLNGLDASDMTYNSNSNTYSLSTTTAFRELPWETAATYGGSTFGSSR